MNEFALLIADDHPLIRKGLREVIESMPQIKTIYEAGDGEAALKIIEQEKPPLAILDVDMPKMNGLDIAKCVQQRDLPTDVIILTMYNKETIFNRAFDLGVMGYILKDSVLAEISTCISNVFDGKYYISPAISDFLIRRTGRQTGGGKEKKLGLTALTLTERKVLALIAKHKTTNEIADELFVSPRTIETHRHNICAKLGIHGTNALLRFAFDNKSFL
jgi:DNA-binding NarL/FixJ family response regulator